MLAQSIRAMLFDSYFTVDLAGRQNGGLIAEKKAMIIP